MTNAGFNLEQMKKEPRTNMRGTSPQSKHGWKHAESFIVTLFHTSLRRDQSNLRVGSALNKVNLLQRQ